MANHPVADLELTHKFVAVLNRKIPVGNLMNALGHMTAGLAGSYSNLFSFRKSNVSIPECILIGTCVSSIPPFGVNIFQNCSILIKN